MAQGESARGTTASAADGRAGASKSAPRRNGRARLDPETVLAAAERVLQQDGLEALTMRRVGAELNADPTAIYRHFRNKDDLLLALADRAFGRVPRIEPGIDWRDGIRQLARDARKVYEVHPDFAAMLARQPDQTPNLEAITEDTLRLFSDAGLTPEQAGWMYGVVVNHVAGTGLFYAVSGTGGETDQHRAANRRAFATLPPHEFPHATRVAEHLFPDPGEVYERGTQMVIDAIASLADQNKTSER